MDEAQKQIAPYWIALKTDAISREAFDQRVNAVIDFLADCPGDLAEIAMPRNKYTFDLLRDVEHYIGDVVDDDDFVLRAIATAVDRNVIDPERLPFVFENSFLDDEWYVMNSPSEDINDLYESYLRGGIEHSSFRSAIERVLAGVKSVA